MSDVSGGDESGVADLERRRAWKPWTIVAIIVGALVVTGGGAALGVVVGQQHPVANAQPNAAPVDSASPQTPASAQPTANPTASATAGPTASATPSATARPTAKPSLDWAVINGRWCSDIDCHTITNLKDERGEIYKNDTGLDANGCLVGIVAPPNDPTEGHTTYCPPGSPFLSSTNPDCHMPEDVSRERLYLFIDCGDPYYRK